MNYRSLVIFIGMLCFGTAMAQDPGISPEDEILLKQLRSFAQQKGIQVTAEQERVFLQQQRSLQDRVKAASLGMMMGMPGAQPPPASIGVGGQGATVAVSSPSPSTAEDGLAALVSALPSRPEHLTIEDRKDGFNVNGRGYVDPEGRIRNYAINPVSGLATYLAETTSGTFLIKVMRAGSDAEPVLIGTAIRSGGGWQVDTVTGKRMTGQSLTVVAGAGILVTRDTAAFLYRPGKGMLNVAVPNGFLAARFQRGDILGTNHLLLERDVRTANGGKNIFETFKSLGGALHLNKTEDYALLNLTTGGITPINISESGKDVGNYSNCRKKNALVNTCGNVDFRESLYDNTGRNLSHYYWRINWFSTSANPILIAQENGLRDITIKDLKSGKKVTAFSRELGIAGYDATQNSDGKIRIAARMGFSTEKIDDAVAFLTSTPEQVSGSDSPVDKKEVGLPDSSKNETSPSDVVTREKL